MSRWMIGLVVLLTLGAAPTPAPKPTANTLSNSTLVDALSSVVESRFHDKALLKSIDWPSAVAKARRSLPPDAPLELQQHVANELLGKLNSPIAALYSDADEDYYAWASLIAPATRPALFRSVGASFERHGAKWFVRHAFEASPASGRILAGDEVVSTGKPGFEPFAALQALPSEGKFSITVRRKAVGPTETYTLPTALDSWFSTWLRDTRESQRVVPTCSRKIGYLRLWAIGPDGFYDALRRASQVFEKEADALVLDLRDGFPAGDFRHAEGLFTPKSPNFVFTKRLVVLVNGRTGGPLEALATRLRDAGRAVVAGTPTMGALTPVDVVPIVGQGPRFLAIVPSAPAPEWARSTRELAPNVTLDAPSLYQAGTDSTYAEALRLAAECSSR